MVTTPLCVFIFFWRPAIPVLRIMRKNVLRSLNIWKVPCFFSTVFVFFVPSLGQHL
ncbi:hypothetical protein L873DRAFT_1799125, partial [Choiromyces venosus 120613-1]